MRNNTLLQYSELLKSRKISSVELTKLYLSEIEKSDINAFACVCRDKALSLAESADKALAEGNADLLCGIPMTLKDNISTDGILTTCSSKMLEGYVPFYDATAWEKLKSKGAVLLGKTNMDEFAMGSTCETSAYGATLNPWDKTKVPGGSSGGAAASVAAGLCAYALGSDTGGSVRQPASFCGVVGLKPTYGSVSRYGLIAYGSSLDQIGVLAGSVRDTALVFDAIKGKDEKDATSVDVSGASALSSIGGGVKGMKIGYADEFFDGLDEEIAEKIRKALAFYEENGAEIVKVSLPSLKLALPVYYIIACAEASSNLGRYDGIRYGHRADKYENVEEMITLSRSQGFGEEVKRRIMLGTYVLSSGYMDAYYKKACHIRKSVIAELEGVFEKCDVLVSPTAPNTAFPLNYSNDNRIQMYLSDICTVPVNITGIPAVSVPCGLDKSGMPIGLQIMGKKFAENTILSAAAFFEDGFDSGVGTLDGGVRL